jgi:hypothetical protein
MTNCTRCNKKIEGKNHYGQHPECFKEIFGVNELLDFSAFAPKSGVSSNKFVNSPHLTSFFGGNYKKYEAKLNLKSYILKLSSKKEYPELAPVEFLCNKIAWICDIKVPVPFTLININNELAFVSRNFMDLQKQHSNLEHIYHFIKEGPGNYNVENLADVIYKQTNSTKDVHMFFKTLMFDALIGNHDRHGRNLAFISFAKKRILAPIYDNPSYLGLESGGMLKATFAPHGKIATNSKQDPLMNDYLEELNRLNVSDLIYKFFNSIKIEKISLLIDNSFGLSNLMKEAIKKLVKSRYEDLKNYVEKNHK